MIGPLLLFLTTFIWGTAFLAQKYGAANLGPFSMTVFRNILGGGFLLFCVLIRNWKCRGESAAEGKSIRHSIFAGICCGVPLSMAMATQQIGIESTSPGICAFLTTNYVLFVPVIVAILTRKMPTLKICIGVVMALIGTYFICMTGANAGGGFSGVGKGELWTILCAVFFSIQMVTVDHFAAKVDLLVMSAVQLLTCSVIAAPFLLMDAEASKIAAGGILHAWIPLIYCGIFSSGIAYTLQNFAQARTPAAVAAILLSMESVFGTISGFVCLGDRMSIGQTTGCLVVLAAVIWTQLPTKSNTPS